MSRYEGVLADWPVEPDPFGEARKRPSSWPALEQRDCVPPPATLPDDRSAIDRLLDEAGPDELRVVLYIAQRLISVGQRQYGKLSLATDKRNMKAEAAAEFGDGAVYGTGDALQGGADGAAIVDGALAGLRRCLK